MSLPRRPGPLGAFALVLLLAGIVCAGLYRVVAGTENHSFSPGAVPATTAQLTEGRTYHLAVPGGVGALTRRGVQPAQLQCDWSAADSSRQVLALSAEGAGSKATDTIATFVAPFTGDVHIDCAGWGTVFVDDADNAGADVSGYLLIACMAAFLLGGVLGLAALRGRALASRRAVREDGEIERLVDLVHLRSRHDEVGGADRGHVAP